MTINSRIRERGIRTALIVLLYVMIGFYSFAQAQSFTPTKRDEAIRLTNAGKIIQHAPSANLTAHAVKLIPSTALTKKSNLFCLPVVADNSTLYFASKGHNGYGGHDIFVTKRLDTWTNWSEPKNLGPAVNSGLDDEFFSITHCGNFAVFSKQMSVHNVDLFRISIEDLFGQPAVIEHKRVENDNMALAAI